MSTQPLLGSLLDEVDDYLKRGRPQIGAGQAPPPSQGTQQPARFGSSLPQTVTPMAPPVGATTPIVAGPAYSATAKLGASMAAPQTQPDATPQIGAGVSDAENAQRSIGLLKSEGTQYGGPEPSATAQIGAGTSQPDWLKLQQEHDAAKPTAPDPTQYHPSTARKIGGYAAGALIGALSPQAGAQIGSRIMNGPEQDLEKAYGFKEKQWEDQGKLLTGEEALAREQGTAQSESDLRAAQAVNQRSEAEHRGETPASASEWSIVPGFQGPNGEPVEQEKSTGQIRIAPGAGGTPETPAPSQGTGSATAPGAGASASQPAIRAKAPANEEEKAITDHLVATNRPDTPANRDAARKELKALDRAPREPTDNDRAIADYIGANKLPNTPANRTKARQELKILEKGPNAAETLRADMAQNLNENLDQLEGIVNRRPKLFGPVYGRITGARELVGTNDPDIGALKVIEDMMGRAQVSAHGMRNGAQVEKAANSILNSFKNGPDAVESAIKNARNSVNTFTQDVEAKGGTTPQNSRAGSTVYRYDSQGNRIQ